MGLEPTTSTTLTITHLLCTKRVRIRLSGQSPLTPGHDMFGKLRDRWLHWSENWHSHSRIGIHYNGDSFAHFLANANSCPVWISLETVDDIPGLFKFFLFHHAFIYAPGFWQARLLGKNKVPNRLRGFCDCDVFNCKTIIINRFEPCPSTKHEDQFKSNDHKNPRCLLGILYEYSVEFCKGARQSVLVSLWQYTLVG